MRRITLVALSTVTVLVLLFSYRTSTSSQLTTGTSAAAAAPPATSTTTSGSAPSAPSTSPSESSGSSGSTAATTYTGSSVDTRWGPVQVQITVANGKITDAQAVVYPQDNPRDQQINAYALPILAQEAVSAQSAQIDAVSGATVTSDGYISSLQSAIDQAHL